MLAAMPGDFIMPTRTKRNAQPKADAAAAKEAPQPERSPDELRADFMRKLGQFVCQQRKTWRSCPRTGCRRARACTAPNYECINLPPAPPMTPEREAAIKASFFHAVRRELARRGIAR
jgi:hypothetical protein